MTDITELATAMKAAAMKATPGQWVAFTHTDSRTFSVHTPDDKRCGDVIKWAGFDGQRKAKANAEFIALANPANVITLVEALEKAQQYAKERDAENQDLMLTVGRLRVEREGQESRTVKLPGWFVKDAIAVYDRDEIEEALAAAGIKWEAK
jgi:hypothetical protein